MFYSNRRMGYLPLLVVTFLYICLFIYITLTTQLDELRRDWPSKRCYPVSMLVASYIPDPKDNVDRAKFSSDNFQFCIQEIIDGAIGLVMVPILSTFSAQVSTAKTTNNSINTMRNAASTGVANPFNSLINYAWKKTGYLLANMRRVFGQLNSAFERIFGITIAAAFAGVSVVKSITNTIQLFIKVIIILLIIIISLLFLIFIPISPFIGILIIPTIIAISAFGYESQVGGMQGSFNCVSPGTLVKAKDGWKPVESIRLGENLDEGRVLGILYGKGGSSVTIDSVVISSLHIVYDTVQSAWVFAKDHVRAVPCESPPYVYSLVTSTRTWTVKGEAELLLRDWTHLDRGDEALDRMISSLLGTPIPVAGQMGLVGSKSVVNRDGKSVTIDSIEVGDLIQDMNGLTRVTSIYRSVELGNATTPNASVRILTSKGWIRPGRLVRNEESPLMHIGTESGTFLLNGLIIRDVNEVGSEHFTTVEEFLLSCLNRNEQEKYVPCGCVNCTDCCKCANDHD